MANPSVEVNGFGRYNGKQQQSLLNIIGEGTITGVAEVEAVEYNGTRSNVFTPSSNEIVTLTISDQFNSGVTQADTQLDLPNQSDSVTHEIGNAYSWPTGDIAGMSLPTGWTYTEGNGSSDSRAGSQALITNGTGSSVSFANMTFAITINVTSLPVSGFTRPQIAVFSPDSQFASGTASTITTLGSHVFNGTALDLQSPLQDGEALRFFMLESEADEQGFSYSITNMIVNSGGSQPASYNLDIDIDNSVFDGNVVATFDNNIGSTQAITDMSASVVAMFPSITSGTVYDSQVSSTGTTPVQGDRQTSGKLDSSNWDIRDAANISSSSINYTSWNDFTGNYFAWAAFVSTFFELFDVINQEATFNNVTLTLIDSSDSSINATFNLDSVSQNGDSFFSLQSIASQSGIPGTGNVSWDLSLTGDVASKSIDLDTNQISNISQMLTITQNDSYGLDSSVSASDGSPSSGQASTYTVTDPYGAQLTSFTSSVASTDQSDISSVVATIVATINANTETPIDFTATSNASTITISAATGGVVPGVWVVSFNHHNQTDDLGNILFNPATIITNGLSPSIVFSGGGLFVPLVVTNTSLTKQTIIDGFLSSGTAGVSVYDDSNADIAIVSDRFYEEPQLSITQIGDVETPFTFSITTKYWGASTSNSMYPDFNIQKFNVNDRKQQQSLLNISGDGTMMSGTETQEVSYFGTRSNVFVVGSDEIVTIDLIESFDSSTDQTAFQLDFDTASDSITHTVSDPYSWPTGDISGDALPEGWSYTPGTGSGATDDVSGLVTNNTGSAVDTMTFTASVTINVTSLPVGGVINPTFFLRQRTNLIVLLFGPITSTGSYTKSSSDSGSIDLLFNGQSLEMFMFENVESEKPFDYTVTDIQFNFGASTAASYSFDVDVDDSVFTGTVTNTFPGNNATTALELIASDVSTMFPTITSGSVYDSMLPSTGTQSISSSRDFNGSIGAGRWDLRAGISSNSSSIFTTDWEDWVGNYFGLGTATSTLTDLTVLLQALNGFDNPTMTFTSSADPTITASFEVNFLTGVTNRYYLLNSLISQSGSPSGGNTFWDILLVGNVPSKAIDLDTNQNTDISQMITLTPNSGTAVLGQVTASNGGGEGVGQPSTYTVIDPYGSEVTSFTSSVSANTDSDINFVVTTIVNAINANTETPIDFTATSNGTEIIITAVAEGEIPGGWTLTINNNGQVIDVSNITLSQAIQTSPGTDLSVRLSGGGLHAPVVITESSLTASELIEDLRDNIGSGVELYDDPDADLAFISDDFEQQPKLEVVVEGNVGDTLDIDARVKYWGHS